MRQQSGFLQPHFATNGNNTVVNVSHPCRPRPGLRLVLNTKQKEEQILPCLTGSRLPVTQNGENSIQRK